MRPAVTILSGRQVVYPVATTALRAGQPIAAESLALKRAVLDDGRYPLQQLERAVGKKPARDVAAGAALYEDDVA